MFDRINNTIRILSYREPKPLPHLTPEIEFKEHVPEEYSPAARFLGKGISAFLVLMVVGVSVTWITDLFLKMFNRSAVSLTAVGITGGIIALFAENLFGAVRTFIARHFGIILMPHLGHKVEKTYRILRG